MLHNHVQLWQSADECREVPECLLLASSFFLMERNGFRLIPQFLHANAVLPMDITQLQHCSRRDCAAGRRAVCTDTIAVINLHWLRSYASML